MAIKNVSLTIGSSSNAGDWVKKSVTDSDFPTTVTFSNLVHHAISFPQFELAMGFDEKKAINISNKVMLHNMATEIEQIAKLQGHQKMVSIELGVVDNTASKPDVEIKSEPVKPKQKATKETGSLPVISEV